MHSKALCAAIAAVVLATGLTRDTHAYMLSDSVPPGPGNALKMRDVGPTKRTIGIKLNAVVFLSFFGFNNGAEPTSGTLRIFNGAGGTDCVAYALPTALWRSVGAGFVGRSGRFRYDDRMASVSPVRSAGVFLDHSQFKLKATVTEPIDYTLDEPMQSSVIVTFTAHIGKLCSADAGHVCQNDADCGGTPGSCEDSSAETCASFSEASKDEPGKFVSHQVASVSACPTPPPGCP